MFIRFWKVSAFQVSVLKFKLDVALIMTNKEDAANAPSLGKYI